MPRDLQKAIQRAKRAGDPAEAEAIKLDVQRLKRATARGDPNAPALREQLIEKWRTP